MVYMPYFHLHTLLYEHMFLNQAKAGFKIKISAIHLVIEMASTLAILS